MSRSKCWTPILMVFVITACEPADDDLTMVDDTMAVDDTTVVAAAGREFSQADRSAIESASERWAAAAAAGNWDEVASLYSEDAILMPPNAEAEEGRDAVRGHLAAFPPLQSIDFDRVHIDGSGDLAYVHGTYTMTFTGPGGQTTEDRGKYIEIWERQDDGQWRITRDIFNSDMPSQPGA